MTDSQPAERELLYSQLENEYGNIVYSQATQEEQQTRLIRTEHNIKVAQIALSALSSAGLVGIFFTQHVWVTALTGLTTFALLFLNSYSFQFEIGTKIVRHRKAGDRLWLLVRKYQSLLVDFPNLSTEEIRKRRDELIDEPATVYREAERTDDRSFNKAKKRPQNEGLKEFSREELNKLLPEELRR